MNHLANRYRHARPRGAVTGRVLLPILLVLLAWLPAAQAERYRIDPEHVSVGFLVEHIGYASVLGLFRAVEGSFEFDEASGVLRDLRVEIETDSVYTAHRKRDEHLRSADFLNSREFPRMVFSAAEARPGDDGRSYQVSGELQLLGQSRPVVLDARWNRSARYPFGGGLAGPPYVMGVSARGSFRRSEFGMNYAVDNGWVGDEVRLIIEFEAIRQ